ncbi:MAG TPA: ABC transporter ATP-binding protein [Candidatus Binatia bacterium]|nr:ABC transporter ATP-binding protein [Candidatus Binatia bacterium]
MIEVRHLQKSFSGHRVLDSVNMRIEKGESVIIIGRSGGGKSVLLKHLIGLLHPEHGEVLVDGQNIVRMNERELIEVRRKFGMLFQGAALFDSMTVAENIGFALQRQRKCSDKEVRETVSEALEMVELAGIENKLPSELSGGMRKRVGLARAIVYRPQILLYDEPTTGLDPVISDSIDQLIISIQRKLKVTSVVVTHDMRSARRIGQRIFMLYHGKIYAEGTPDEIFASQDPVVNHFVNGIAEPRQHLLDDI